MAGVVCTVAGSGQKGFLDGLVSSAQFNGLREVAVDREGNIFVAERFNHCIRKISPQGVVSTLAGSGAGGFKDGQGSAALFKYPWGVAVDRVGNVLVADAHNHCIRKVTSDGVVSTLAGNGTEGFKDGSGSSAQFHQPSGLTMDREGNVLVADQGNHCIRKVTPQGIVSTLAGSGTAGCKNGPSSQASFNQPTGLAVGSEGDVLVADQGNHCIRKIHAGVVSTLAGSQEGFKDGSGSTALFNGPCGLALDRHGNMLVCDFNNNHIRSVTPQGVVSTLAGSDEHGFEDGTSSTALFNGPFGVAEDRDGNVLVADWGNHRIRKIVSRGESKCSTWTRCIRAPASSPFSGGLFELTGRSSTRVWFTVPIFHCNVDPLSGEVGFSPSAGLDTIESALEAVSHCLISPDVSPQAIKNRDAFALWKDDRLEYEVRARKEAAQSWQRIAKDSALLFRAMNILLPPKLTMDRKAQHQIFSQVALVEIEAHLQSVKTSRQEARIARFGHANLHERNVVEEELEVARAGLLQSELKFQLLQTLADLTTLENPSHNKQMEWLEQRLMVLYLEESNPCSPSPPSSCSLSASSSSFTSLSSPHSSLSEKIPLTTSECFGLMVTEAKKEQTRLTELIRTCVKKYELLYARFEVLKNVRFDEGKVPTQHSDHSVEYFLTQAKLLEPSFRSILEDLVATFNREEFPVAVKDRNGSFTKLRMLSGTHAKAIFGPPKSADRVREKVREKGGARINTDYLRATIVMADPLLLVLFYFALQADSSNFTLRHVKNKHNRVNLNQPPNLHVNFEFRGHVCEIQFMLEDFFLIKSFSHKSYRIDRISLLQGPELSQAIARIAVAGVYMIHSGS